MKRHDVKVSVESVKHTKSVKSLVFGISADWSSGKRKRHYDYYDIQIGLGWWIVTIMIDRAYRFVEEKERKLQQIISRLKGVAQK